jgi:hypothetical protein
VGLAPPIILVSFSFVLTPLLRKGMMDVKERRLQRHFKYGKVPKRPIPIVVSARVSWILSSAASK